MKWEPYHSGPSVFVVEKRNNAIICRILVGDASADVRDANAHLIAAAPDLLNALTVLADACEQMDIPVNAARAAIAKARGE